MKHTERAKINYIIMSTKQKASKQQLLSTAAMPHFYTKRLGLSTLQLNRH